jgi:hypothetical protein
MPGKGKPDSLYIVLMYGRVNADDPPGTIDRTGSVVLGPFTSLALEYRALIGIRPGQAALSLLASTGRFVGPEQMLEGIEHFQAKRDWPDIQPNIILSDLIPFDRKISIGGLTVTCPEGETHRFDEFLFYDGYYWAGLLVLSSDIFDASKSWHENYEVFDPLKAVPNQSESLGAI